MIYFNKLANGVKVFGDKVHNQMISSKTVSFNAEI